MSWLRRGGLSLAKIGQGRRRLLMVIRAHVHRKGPLLVALLLLAPAMVIAGAMMMTVSAHAAARDDYRHRAHSQPVRPSGLSHWSRVPGDLHYYDREHHHRPRRHQLDGHDHGLLGGRRRASAVRLHHHGHAISDTTGHVGGPVQRHRLWRRQLRHVQCHGHQQRPCRYGNLRGHGQPVQQRRASGDGVHPDRQHDERHGQPVQQL